MTFFGTLEAGRRAAERLMVDVCTVGRPSGVTTDPTTGAVVSTMTPVYSGKVKVQSMQGLRAEAPESAGHVYTIQRLQLHFPVGGYNPTVNDVATITAAADASLIGRKFRVSGDAPSKSLGTAYRVNVEEVTS